MHFFSTSCPLARRTKMDDSEFVLIGKSNDFQRHLCTNEVFQRKKTKKKYNNRSLL